MSNTKEYYIGLLSGTSIDAIDAALFEINTESHIIKTIAALNHDIPTELKQALNNIIINKHTTLNYFGELNRRLGIVFASAVMKLLKKSQLSNSQITAIGFHGQTIFHQPTLPYNFSMQIGDPNTIIELTNIPVITDFRQRDMVNGGQGAPLAPLFHQKFFYSNQYNRAIINIGGISNITFIPKDAEINTNINNLNYIASDLGPGNTLLDQWFLKNHPENNYTYDLNGAYAKTGVINTDLLNDLLQDSYFHKTWPKSTGREYFNLDWLNNYLKEHEYIIHTDVQRTLLELTAQIITSNILHNNLKLNIDEIYICGGGAYNTFLMLRIKELLGSIKISTTAQLGIDPNWVEAALFAWLASCTWHKQSLNLKYITGNKKTDSILGCLYY